MNQTIRLINLYLLKSWNVVENLWLQVAHELDIPERQHHWLKNIVFKEMYLWLVGNVLPVVVELRSEKPDIGVAIVLPSAILNVCTSCPHNVSLIKTKMKYPKTLATKFAIIFNHHLYAIFKILFFNIYPYYYMIIFQ